MNKSQNNLGDHGLVTEEVVQWVKRFVIAQQLCPFAAKPMLENAVRFEVSFTDNSDVLLKDFLRLLDRLLVEPKIETILLIHPNVGKSFDDYLGLVATAEGLIEQLALDGIFQVASFHPDYCFDRVEPDDLANFSNRSPYPMLHLLRESSIEQAIESYPEIEQLPDKNIARLRALTLQQLQAWRDR